MEIYEERESVHIVEPMHEIVTAGGLVGWATLFEYTDEVVEEITLDLPGEPHALLYFPIGLILALAKKYK